MGNESLPIKRGCMLLLSGMLPAYFLSIQWVGLPNWLYGLAGLGGVLQLVGSCWIWWSFIDRQDEWKGTFGRGLHKWLLLALTIFIGKCLFQMLSILPEIYEMVFHARKHHDRLLALAFFRLCNPVYFSHNGKGRLVVCSNPTISIRVVDIPFWVSGPRNIPFHTRHLRPF